MHFYKAKKNIFTGRLYPLFIAVLVLLGSLLEIEVYTAFVNMIIVSIALWKSNTIRPFLFFLLTFAYQLPKDHVYSGDYYFKGANPWILLVGFVSLAVALVAFVIRNGIFYRADIKKIPLFVPLCIMTVGFALNGALYPSYNPMNLVWSVLMMLVYFLVYIIMYLGLKGEDPDEMVEYFTYMTLLISWIMIIQMIYMYVNGLSDGVFGRDDIEMGYGVCNLIGFHITTLIPVNFYGFMRSKYPAAYMVTAYLLFIANFATTSRNSILFGTIYFIVCLVLCMFFGKRREGAKIIGLVTLGVVTVIIALIVAYSKNPESFADTPWLSDILARIEEILKHSIGRTFGEDGEIEDATGSGRTEIWKRCFGLFKDNPIFGVGFFGMKEAPMGGQFDFLTSLVPQYAHNTVFELLSATGAVGTIGYGVYRVATAKYMFHKFRLDRFMLLLGASVLVVESLLDNYVFHIYTTFYYVIALAIAVRLYEVQEDKPCRIELLDLKKGRMRT